MLNENLMTDEEIKEYFEDNESDYWINCNKDTY